MEKKETGLFGILEVPLPVFIAGSFWVHDPGLTSFLIPISWVFQYYTVSAALSTVHPQSCARDMLLPLDWKLLARLMLLDDKLTSLWLFI